MLDTEPGTGKDESLKTPYYLRIRSTWPRSRHIGQVPHYAVNYPSDPNPDPALPPAQPGDFVSPQDAEVLAWNSYRIEVNGDVITVSLNGIPTAKYTNTYPNRGRFSAVEPTFIGLQSYSNYSFTTAFRNISVTVL